MTPGLRTPLISSLLGDALSNMCFIFVEINIILIKTVLNSVSSFTRTLKYAFLIFAAIDI